MPRHPICSLAIFNCFDKVTVAFQSQVIAVSGELNNGRGAGGWMAGKGFMTNVTKVKR